MSEYTRLEYVCKFETVEQAQKAVKESDSIFEWFNEDELVFTDTGSIEIQVEGFSFTWEPTLEWVQSFEASMSNFVEAEGFVVSHLLLHGNDSPWNLIYRKDNVPVKMPWEAIS